MGPMIRRIGMRPVLRVMLLGGMAAALSLAAGCSNSSSATTSAATVEIDGSPSVSTFHNGQSVTVSVGPNKVYQPLLRVNIIQCSDPGGKVSELPVSLAHCDENTLQGNSVIAKSDGSIHETGYTIYRVPTSVLGEGKTVTPICDATHECVLYVGQDQDDFTKPKAFSAPFFVTGGTADSQP
jgi:hypothetical protein